MGRINDFFNNVFSKSQSKENEETKEGLGNTPNIEESTNSLEDSGNNEGIAEYRDSIFDVMEKYGMTENEMSRETSQRKSEARTYYEKLEQSHIDAGNVNEWGEIDDVVSDKDFDISQVKYNTEEFDNALYTITMDKMTLSTEDNKQADQYLKQVEEAEYIVEGINSNYGLENIEFLKIRDREKESPSIYAKFEDEYAMIQEQEHSQSFSREDVKLMKLNDPYDAILNDVTKKDRGEISSVNIGDMSFDYQNMKSEKLKDFAVLNETDQLSVTFENNETLSFYNDTQEKNDFNTYDYKGSSGKRQTVDVSKIDISVDDYMNYGQDKYNNSLETNDINRHIEKAVSDNKEQTKQKKKQNDIEI